MLHGSVDAAIPTDLTVPPVRFFDAAASFFGSIARPFVLWVPSSAGSHLSGAVDRGLVRFGDRCPAMVASHPVTPSGGPGVRLATDDESLATFGDVCERGYQQPGMARLMSHRQSYRAPDSFWHVAFADDLPISVACGFKTGDIGGIYSVATPPEFRGRGFAAAATSAATNHLFDLGVEHVILQASTLGYGVYERLGFVTYDHFERFAVPVPAA